MHRVDRSKVHEALHDYKRECYQLEHAPEVHDVVVRDAQRLVHDVLAQNFHYHFHKPVNPERAEVFGMIENYTREAVLPPVVGKLVERIVLLEKRHDAAIRCLERVLGLIQNESKE